MVIHWAIFLSGLLILFYPVDALFRGGVRLRDFEHIASNHLNGINAWWRQLWLWVDPFRAFVGVFLLRHVWEEGLPLPGVWRESLVAGSTLVLGIALAVQMHTRRDDDAFYVPMGYIAGLIFGLLPPLIAVPVVVIAILCTLAFRTWGAFFFCGAVGAAALGFPFLRFNYWLVAAILLILEPILLALLFGRLLMLPLYHGAGTRR